MWKIHQLICFLVRTGDKDTKVCTMAEIQCSVEADYAFSNYLIVEQCHCLPDCTTVTYDVEISQAPYTRTTDIVALRNSLNETE